MDMTMQWYDWCRAITAVLSLTAMYFLGLAKVRRGREFTKKLTDYWWVMNALLFCFVAGSLEQILRDREETWTLFVALIASVVAIKAVTSKERVLLKSDNSS